MGACFSTQTKRQTKAAGRKQPAVVIPNDDHEGTNNYNSNSYSPRSNRSYSYSPRSAGGYSTGKYSSGGYGGYGDSGDYGGDCDYGGGCDYGGVGCGGCFSGECFVTKVHASGDEARIPLKNVKPGDDVKIADGTSAKVVCVVRIARAQGKDLVWFENSNLMITPRHPVHVADAAGLMRWRLPVDLAGAEKTVSVVPQHEDHFVYNLLLEEGKHSLLVSGVACATWGHGLCGEGIEHAFFGSYAKVAGVLQSYPGYKYGFVSVGKGGLLRSRNSHDGRGRCCTGGDMRSRVGDGEVV